MVTLVKTQVKRTKNLQIQSRFGGEYSGRRASSRDVKMTSVGVFVVV